MRDLIHIYTCERGYIGNTADPLRLGQTKWNYYNAENNIDPANAQYTQVCKTLSLLSKSGVTKNINSYRGIENIVGNVWTYIDGLCIIMKDYGSGTAVTRAWAANFNINYALADNKTEAPKEFKQLTRWVECSNYTNDWPSKRLMPGEYFQDKNTTLTNNEYTTGVTDAFIAGFNGNIGKSYSILVGTGYNYNLSRAGVYFIFGAYLNESFKRGDYGTRNVCVIL